MKLISSTQNRIILLIIVISMMIVNLNCLLSSNLRSHSRQPPQQQPQQPTADVQNVEKKNDNGQVFDIFETLGMLKEISQAILDIPSDQTKSKEFTDAMGFCFKQLEDRQNHYEPVLKAFFDRCQNIFDKPDQWDNSIFEETILNALAAIGMKMGNNQTTCQMALKLKQKPDINKIASVFGKTFGGFTNQSAKDKEKFITNQFSSHRNMLPDGSFMKINKVSRTDSKPQNYYMGGLTM